MELNTKKKSDYDLIVGSAVRYALGRQTYIVNTTVDYVIDDINNGDYTLRELVVMARDIMEQKSYGYGWDCDLNDWKRLFEKISEVIKKEDFDTWQRERLGDFDFEQKND